jgi:enoyl-CoA hydratase/carnithine racemase
VNLGVIPGYGGSQRLPRVVGRGFALEMILTGEPVSAERAALIGLVTKVVPPAELLTEARRLAELIASRGPVALSLAIRAVRASDLPLQEGLAIEAELFGKAFDTEDLSEGASAFLERRKPKFKGR